MNRTMNFHVIVLSAVMGIFLLMSGIGHADSKGVSHGHKQVTGVVTTEKGGILTVKTPTGDYSLAENASRRHGHAVPKLGDEVTLVLDENNAVIEAHPKGEEGTHHFYTGKLVYMGKMNKEIKLQTSDGEKVFPLARLEIKTKPIEEGAMVTVEVNEGGTVIDLHRASHDEKNIPSKGKTRG
ncbi:MAG: hypothetical protein KC592_18180 [Nitrospira sp.]|nr:hypothetical protein [Nitrospira sp.]